MALQLPSASITVRSQRQPAAPSSRIHACAGVASKGPFTPTSVGNLDALTETFGFGPAVKAAAYQLGKTGAPVVFRRVAPTVVAADIGDPTLDDWTGANPPALSGTPNDHYNVVFEIVTGTVLGTATYRVSTNGGEDYTSAVATPGDGIITLTGTGITVTLTGAVGGSFTFEGYPASQSIMPVVATRVGSSTSVVTITGTPLDAYEIVLETLTGGTIGTAGIVVRVSLDGGRTFTKALRLGTANTLQIDDGEEDSGLDFAFAAGTLDTGDEFASSTTEPAVQASDVVTAVNQLNDSVLDWSFVHVVGAVTQSAASSIAGRFTAFAADQLGNARFSWALMSYRYRYTNETETAWENAFAEEFDQFENARAAVGFGYARITCPITGRRNRRPATFVAVPELIARPIEESIARKATGPLSSDVQLYEDGERVEHDARISPTAQGARALTLRTYKGQGGVYFTRDSTFDAEGGLEGLIARRRVLDAASEIFRQTLENLLMDGVEVNAPDEPNPGCITEEGAARIDAEVETQIRSVLQGKFSDLTVYTSRTTVLAPGVRLPCKVAITGLEYLDGVEGEIGYVSAALAALAA
jgi:hypothetical protein